ncbi:MAG: TetR/AcrR family transcriptional regulator [Pseudomonadota bacterium]
MRTAFGEKTKGKILYSSLTLFNTDGFDAVTTSRIAEAASVLDGTLWYHFNAKSDLVSAHLIALEQSLKDQFDTANTSDHPFAVEQFLGVFDVLWDFRYLLRDPLQDLQRDPLFAKRLQSAYTSVEEQAKLRLTAAAEEGLLDLSEIDAATLAASCVIIGRYWFDYSRVRNNVGSKVEQHRLEGIQQIVSILRPHFTERAKSMFKNAKITLPSQV